MPIVIHSEYGEGRAVCFCERDGKTFLVVDFGEVKKDFIYPDAFKGELRAKDENMQKQILAELEQ